MKKRIFKTNIRHGNNMSFREIRDMAKGNPGAFVQTITDAAEKGQLRFSDIPDLKELYRYTADVLVPVNMTDISGAERAIKASAFPILTGTLAIAGIQEAYDAVPSIGQDLVTEMDDNKKITTLVNLETLDKEVDEVKELDDFPEVGVTEDYVEIRHKRNGRKLTISAEAIEENDAPNIIARINKLGEIMGEWEEEQTLQRVTDHYGSGSAPTEPYAYRPSGTGTQLYNATANNPGTRAPSGTRVESNALEDETDIDNARTVLAAMKNGRGKRIFIPWSDVYCLVPYAVVGKASKVFNSEYVPGVENEMSNYGPVGRWHIPPERLLTTPKLDDLSTSAWYLGAFKRQFVRKWKLRVEYVTLGQDTQAYLNSRVAFQARIAWDMEVGATDYVYVVQNLSATTAPVDE